RDDGRHPLRARAYSSPPSMAMVGAVWATATAVRANIDPYARHMLGVMPAAQQSARQGRVIDVVTTL
ncbi:MAG TPA: hypothetical protein VIK13_09705, partial [Candidatus Limnocylindrales bacterium]